MLDERLIDDDVVYGILYSLIYSQQAVGSRFLVGKAIGSTQINQPLFCEEACQPDEIAQGNSCNRQARYFSFRVPEDYANNGGSLILPFLNAHAQITSTIKISTKLKTRLPPNTIEW